MSESVKSNVQPEELNITSSPDEAVNAATIELNEQNSIEEETQQVQTEAAGAAEEVNEGSKPATRQDIIERLKAIAESDDVLTCKSETESLKVQFYRMRTAEIELAHKEFLALGGEADLFIPQPDELEESFKEAMGLIKTKRNEWLAAQEKEMQANYDIKMSLLEQLQALVDKAAQGNPEVAEFKALQQRWKEVKNVPQDKVAALWKQYQLLVEQFYDVLKLNNEFREYDFKKNLEIKTKLCEAAEALEKEEDVIAAFRQLQQLHNDFREAGPVAPELREEVWGRFKAASTTVNRRHQEYFEAKKQKEQDNLDKKVAICEEIEGMDFKALAGYQAWNDATQRVLDLQTQWKEIGFAPQKMNLKVFERFRAACDEFFKQKSEFFKEAKNALANNLERKKALCELAEQLKDSEDWKATTEKLTKLQKEWKEVGPVAQKHSEALCNCM